MGIAELTGLIAAGMPEPARRDAYATDTRAAIESIFGERYRAKTRYGVRTVILNDPEAVSFAGLVHEESPTSGVYGGMSLIWFPVENEGPDGPSSLISLICGTRGLAPDEHILGRPGHARHLRALRRHLRRTAGVDLWVKQDPTALGEPPPRAVRERLSAFRHVFERYGDYLYAAAEVPRDPATASTLVRSLFDLYAWERGWAVLKGAAQEIESLKLELRANLFPQIDHAALAALLRERRFVILQGPPGTGKTRLAAELMADAFSGHGMTVQFHPSVTYETFVAGISPDVAESQLRFEIRAGWLVEAAQAAEAGDYLLVLDEINRADLGRVLGEAIHLFEAREIAAGAGRSVALPHALASGVNRLRIPAGLYVLGTMNTADRSIAAIDIAVRRRFAFVDLWPDIAVVARQSIPLATEAFGRLLDIFAQYAPDDALVMVPGHAYFLADSEQELMNRLNYELRPLLQDYLREGRLGSCEAELRGYLDWLEGAIDAPIAAQS